MDFLKITVKEKNGVKIVEPDFVFGKKKDIMIRGKAFYAVWDEEAGMWSTDEFDLIRLVDNELYESAESLKKFGENVQVSYLRNLNSSAMIKYRQFISMMPDLFVPLDSNLTFSNTKVKKSDHASKRLSYPLEEGSYDAWDELVGTLYSPEERDKIEWAIGSIVTGDSKYIQKFLVFFGDAGTGKSTILNVISKLFDGYTTTFEAKALTSNNNQFSTEPFKSNPLVAIQHDGDLSRIEDNTKLNSIVSHEIMSMNEKYRPVYTGRSNCFLFMGTNKPVKITDAKAGVIRRLIDVRPTGNKIPNRHYQDLMRQIDFELGAIAWHCKEVYEDLGVNYYDRYRPVDMMYKTDVFFNFVEDNCLQLDQEEGITLRQAYNLYKAYCEESYMEYKLPMYRFREELKNYFKTFHERVYRDGKVQSSLFEGFLKEKLERSDLEANRSEKARSGGDDSGETTGWLFLDNETSIFDTDCADCISQYGNADEKPFERWANVTRTLREIDTRKIHYVKVPSNHIVIDFDLKDKNGEKSAELNIKEANKFPPTYAEFSKGGAGVHLHYIYDGDVSKLSRVYSDGIEVKVFTGNASLRRRLTKCNTLPIAHINSGLPLKEEKKMINLDSVKSEKGLRDLIERNLRKEIHPGTKPSIDFIFKILEDAYDSDLSYDVTDMRQRVLAFAVNSSHHSQYCVRLVNEMHFKSDEVGPGGKQDAMDDRYVFFDVEVFPNLFLVNWKFDGDEKCVRMINPKPSDMEELFKYKLIGFNCRRYDNHICYARWMGYTNEQLFDLSQRIINGGKNCFFGEAYNISYTDVYDFASAGNKKSLKKWEIELGIHHMELGLPWDKPVPEEKWIEVAEYCDNDVISTEAVFHHLSGDWAARQILSELSGLSVNDTTNQHSAKIIFGDNKHPQDVFNYTDLSEMFPGYKYENGKSTYRGEETGEGGYVYSEPGMYTDVALLDVASMHPSSIEALNLFGPYTRIFSDIKLGRLAFKHKDKTGLEGLLDGKLIPFFERAETGEYSFGDVANALKTVINSVYGLTSAKFDNPFRDIRNKDNIVAKRGALFMIDLKHAVQEKGFVVAHIKTDSIKIPNATREIIEFVMDFGKRYGYTFEHEDTYERMCLVNDAVYIAKYNRPHIDKKTGKEIWWTATGAQFAVPYVFKTLFSHDSIEFRDLCEAKSVTSALYLDMNEGLSDGEHNYEFVGKVGEFCPIQTGCGGGELFRMKDNKYYSVGGTKGYRWLESEKVKNLGLEESIDMGYFRDLVDAAVDNISQYGDFEWFVSDDPTPPWETDCYKETLPF